MKEPHIKEIRFTGKPHVHVNIFRVIKEYYKSKRVKEKLGAIDKNVASDDEKRLIADHEYKVACLRWTIFTYISTASAIFGSYSYMSRWDRPKPAITTPLNPPRPTASDGGILRPGERNPVGDVVDINQAELAERMRKVTENRTNFFLLEEVEPMFRVSLQVNLRAEHTKGNAHAHNLFDFYKNHGHPCVADKDDERTCARPNPRDFSYDALAGHPNNAQQAWLKKNGVVHYDREAQTLFIKGASTRGDVTSALDISDMWFALDDLYTHKELGQVTHTNESVSDLIPPPLQKTMKKYMESLESFLNSTFTIQDNTLPVLHKNMSPDDWTKERVSIVMRVLRMVADDFVRDHGLQVPYTRDSMIYRIARFALLEKTPAIARAKKYLRYAVEQTDSVIPLATNLLHK